MKVFDFSPFISNDYSEEQLIRLPIKAIYHDLCNIYIIKVIPPIKFSRGIAFIFGISDMP